MSTVAQRKATERERRRAAGFERFEAWVHRADVPQIRRYVERLAAIRRVKTVVERAARAARRMK